MLLYIALLNCLLSLLMIGFNWKINRNVIFLALMILLISTYTITYYFLALGQSRFWAAVFYTNWAPLWYLPGPLLYCYVRSNLEDQIRFRKTDLLHFIPFAVSLIGIIPYLLTPFEYKLEIVDALLLNPDIPKLAPTNWLLPMKWNLLLRPTLLIGYSFFCLGMIVRAQRSFSRSSEVAQDQWVFLRNWMFILTVVLIITSTPTLILSYFYSFEIHIDYSRINTYAISSVTAYAQFLISLTLLIFPRILYGIPRTTSAEKLLNASRNSIPADAQSEPGFDDSDASGVETEEKVLNPLPFVELSQRILSFMEEQKPYLDPDFTLDSLARSLDIPKHHLYYCFQNILKTKFTRLRTAYRIEHAKKQLTEADFTRTKMSNVGKESGFASTSAFYSTFKTEVGCSPGEFAARINPAFRDDYSDDSASSLLV